MVANIGRAERSEQLVGATTALLRQLGQGLLASRIPFRWPPRARGLEQAHDAVQAPLACPVLYAVQMHTEARRDHRERLAARQLLQRLRALSHTGVGVMNTHLVQGARLCFIQLQTSHDLLVVAHWSG